MATNGVNNTNAVYSSCTTQTTANVQKQEDDLKFTDIFTGSKSNDGKNEFIEGALGGVGVKYLDDTLFDGRTTLRSFNPVLMMVSSDVSGKEKAKSLFDPLTNGANSLLVNILPIKAENKDKVKNVLDWFTNPVGSLVACFCKGKDDGGEAAKAAQTEQAQAQQIQLQSYNI